MWPTNKRSQQEKEFAEIYDNYADSLFRYCFFKTSNREQSLDLTQQTFLKIWEQITRGTEIKNYKAFLYHIANNLIIDWYRSHKSASLDEMMEETGFEVENPQDDPTQLAEKEQALKLLWKLEGKDREIVILRYVEDMSVKEIAESFKETENSISVRLHRALKKLRENFKDIPYGG